MTYDDAGNMTEHADLIKGFTKTMNFDSANRIKTVTNKTTGKVVGQYYYDDGGFRIRRISKRKENGEEKCHEVLYPNMYLGLEIQRDDMGGVISGSYASVNNVYLSGLRIAAVVPGGDTTHYLTDNIDSVRVVVNHDGMPTTRTEYYPYGDTWFQEGDAKNAPKYNSQELDKESGLYFYNARYYEAGMGRFVTADNVVDGFYDTQGWNRYSYVKGNPIRYGDPSGNVKIFEISLY